MEPGDLTPDQDRGAGAAPDAPQLPHSAPRTAPPMVSSPPPQAGVGPGASTWYRTDHERYRSVYRRANPWYRRLARGLFATVLIGTIGVGLYVGATELRDYLNRDRLPSAGREAATFRSTSFLLTSTAPGPSLAGTLTIDTTTQAFEFIGSATLPDGTPGPQAGLTVVSPDGSRAYLGRDGQWQAAETSAEVTAIRGVLPYLLGVDDADDIFVNRLRPDYVELLDKTAEGVGDDALDRYELSIDTFNFSANFPLQWGQMREVLAPAAEVSSSVALTIWIDQRNVVTRLTGGVAAPATWSWQRLAYNDTAFVPVDPGGIVAPPPSTAPP